MSDGPASVIVDSTGANIAEVKAASTAAVATDKALVVAVSPNNIIPVKQTSSTATTSSIAASISSVTLLAANVSRRGATIFNDSNRILYVRLGSTASTTNYTVQLGTDAYYEVPYGYTGEINGIWVAGSSGNARITELS